MKKLLPLLVTVILSLNAFAGSFTDISLADLKAAISSKKVTLLDVNGPVTYANGHIPGAIDYTAHTTDLAKLLPADKNSLIVAYCGNEHCGAYARAAEAAQNSATRMCSTSSQASPAGRPPVKQRRNRKG